MTALPDYDRLTPSRVRKIALLIRTDRAKARELANKTVSSLAGLIPDRGIVGVEKVEEAFLAAIEMRKIFAAAELQIWDFFPRPTARSLLGHIFISAVEGASLREIVAEAARLSSDDGLSFDVERFALRQSQDDAARAVAG